mmetsp:Transcript_23480/g.74841  ORF Transcript_23480/g.74841 Transcript_23480/m.74841 type:complete len:324 (+) Transcript_23480:71-1042(+)
MAMALAVDRQSAPRKVLAALAALVALAAPAAGGHRPIASLAETVRASLARAGPATAGLDSAVENLIDEAWEHIEQQNYTEGIVFDNDDVQVTLENRTCVVVAQETSRFDLDDWLDNTDQGFDPIMAIQPVFGQDISCGCAERGTSWSPYFIWWPCKVFNECEHFPVLGEGYDGFTKQYNSMRHDIWDAIVSRCGLDLNEYRFVGYSRGGAIMSVVAFALFAESLLPAESMKLVTFGAPRSLESLSSDLVHGQFEQFRVVYRSDVVPMLPISSFFSNKLKHFGELVCNTCAFDDGRDAPPFSRGFSGQDHLEYCKFYGDLDCLP